MDHFADKHTVDMVAIHLIEQSMQPLLKTLCHHTKKGMVKFVETYEKKLNRRNSQWPANSSSTVGQADIQIRNCFTVREDEKGSRVVAEMAPPSGASSEDASDDVVLLEDGGGGGEEDVEIVAAVVTTSSRTLASSVVRPGPKSPGIVFVPAR